MCLTPVYIRICPTNLFQGGYNRVYRPGMICCSAKIHLLVSNSFVLVIGSLIACYFHYAAIPTVSSNNISIDGFLETYTMLTCPIRLPSESSLYRIQWEEFIGSFSIQLRNRMISPDSTTLSVLISSNDQRVFRCSVGLQRCSGISHCSQAVFNIVGPFMVINNIVAMGKSINTHAAYTCMCIMWRTQEGCIGCICNTLFEARVKGYDVVF